MALVRTLLDRGAAKVYACARRQSALDSVITLDHTRTVGIQLDVTNAADRFHVAQIAQDVRLLFNNAGVLDLGGVLDVSVAATARAFDVNCFGLLHVTRALAPAVVANHGAVVHVLTLVALASMPGLGLYNASKAAAWSITQSLRADLGKQGVSVFSVFPGAIDTDMFRGFDMPTQDIFPDPMSQALYGQWVADHKAVERQFASMGAEP